MSAPELSALPASFPTLKSAPAFCARKAVELARKLRALGVKENDGLLLAVSGGADSLALMALCALARDVMPVKLHVLSCDHGLRKTSGDEAAFVEALGKVMGIPAGIARLHMDINACALEERARASRYRALEDARRSLGFEHVLLAHHAGDLAEDILMRLVRGTGWPGLGGMEEKDGERHLLRPLLEEDAKTLRKVLELLGIPHCEDESNEDGRYFRNRVRSEVLPLLRRENPCLERSLVDLARLARLDREHFAKKVEEALRSCETRIENGSVCASVPRTVLESLDPAVRSRLCLALVHRLVALGVQGQARARTFQAVEEALRLPQRPKTFQLPGGIRIVLDSAGLHFEGEANKKAPEGA